MDRAPGELAVADLAAARSAHSAGLADRERREIVMQENVSLYVPCSASIHCSSSPVPSVATTGPASRRA
jgi:hypothetical protein